jgi:hypothetical protein
MESTSLLVSVYGNRCTDSIDINEE